MAVKTKLSMVIMSHLSDMQEEFIYSKKETNRINFIKWLLLRYSGHIARPNPNPSIPTEVITLSTDIDADADWNEFIASPYYKP